jgi:hypothetical protein
MLFHGVVFTYGIHFSDLTSIKINCISINFRSISFINFYKNSFRGSPVDICREIWKDRQGVNNRPIFFKNFSCNRVQNVTQSLFVSSSHNFRGSGIAQSVQRLATGPNDRGNRSLSPSRVKNILFSTSSWPSMGFTRPPIQRVREGISPGWSSRGLKLTIHLQLVPRLRKYGSIHALPHTPSWRSA